MPGEPDIVWAVVLQLQRLGGGGGVEGGKEGEGGGAKWKTVLGLYFLQSLGEPIRVSQAQKHITGLSTADSESTRRVLL